MKKIFFSLLVCLSCISMSYAQVQPDRYRTNVFTSVAVTPNVTFSTNIIGPKPKGIIFITSLPVAVDENDTQLYTLKMDIYKPVGDTNTRRPVIILCFGGGFIQGTRDMPDMVQLATEYAKRGFVTASIDYRLGININNTNDCYRTVYRALQDGRSAVRFFRNNATTHGIDPNQIYIGGHSAGAFIAMQNAYLDKESERPASTFGGAPFNGANQGTLDGVGDNKTDALGNPVSGKANAAITFAGALGFLSHIEGPNDIPVNMFHNDPDPTVDFGSKKPFGNLGAFTSLPIVEGSSPVHTRANTVAAPHFFEAYNTSIPLTPNMQKNTGNRGHGVHFDDTNVYTDIIPKSSMFLYDRKLLPATQTILGSTLICDQNLTQTYTLSNSSNFYYDWSITGGVINTPSVLPAGGYDPTKRQYLNSISVTWNATGGARSLSVTAYQRNLAQGTILTQNFTLNNAPVAATAVPTQNIQIGGGAQTVNITTAFTDANTIPANPITYTATSSNTANLTVSISATGIVTLTPLTTGTGGAITVTLTAIDRSCESAPVTFVVNINRPPIATVIPNQTLQLSGANGALNIASFFSDPDGNTLTFTSTNATPTVATATLVGSTFTLAPVAGGSTVVTVTANDGNGGTVSQTFTVLVNTAPTSVGTITTQTIQVGSTSTLSLLPFFADADGNPLTYTAVFTPTGVATATFVGGVMTISGVAGGTTSVTITANDGNGGTITQTFTITVNRPPVATTIPNQTLQLGGANGTLNIASYFTDADGNTLTFTSTNATPSIATVVLAGSTFTLAPIAGGSTIITVTANDGNGGTISQTFVVNVTTCAITATPTIIRNLLTLTSSSATNNQWNRDGVAIVGATSNILNVTQGGSYTVSLVGVTNACAVVTSLPTVISIGDIATSLDKNLENVSLSPNPTKGGFQISMNNALRGDYEVVIFDALGKVQSSKKLNKTSLQVTEQFSIENLAVGVYYVKIISKEGVITKKVVLSE